MLMQSFNLHPSKQYFMLILILLLTSIVITFILPVFFLLKVAIVVFIMLYGGHTLWRYGLLSSPDSIKAIHYYDDGRFEVKTQNKSHDVILRGDSTLSSLVSILRFNHKQKALPLSCIICRDSLPAGDYRRLLVILRMR